MGAGEGGGGVPCLRRGGGGRHARVPVALRQGLDAGHGLERILFHARCEPFFHHPDGGSDPACCVRDVRVTASSGDVGAEVCTACSVGRVCTANIQTLVMHSVQSLKGLHRQHHLATVCNDAEHRCRQQRNNTQCNSALGRPVCSGCFQVGCANEKCIQAALLAGTGTISSPLCSH